jgi:hypothetical protein
MLLTVTIRLSKAVTQMLDGMFIVIARWLINVYHLSACQLDC